jgi:hypothetical protein
MVENKMEIIRYLPRCVSSEDYRAWNKLQPRAGKAGFCEDCTPTFKMTMMDLGRCDHPEIRFCRDDDGFLTGTVTQADADSMSFDLFLN